MKHNIVMYIAIWGDMYNSVKCAGPQGEPHTSVSFRASI